MGRSEFLEVMSARGESCSTHEIVADSESASVGTAIFSRSYQWVVTCPGVEQKTVPRFDCCLHYQRCIRSVLRIHRYLLMISISPCACSLRQLLRAQVGSFMHLYILYQPCCPDIVGTALHIHVAPALFPKRLGMPMSLSSRRRCSNSQFIR